MVHEGKDTLDLSPDEFSRLRASIDEGSRTVSVSGAAIVDNDEQKDISLENGVLISIGKSIYSIVQHLGSGCNGGVAFAEKISSSNSDLSDVVIKYAFPGCEEALHREIQYMKKLKHAGVVRLIDQGSVSAKVKRKEESSVAQLEVLVAERLSKNPYGFYDSKPLPLSLAIDMYVNLLRTLEDIHRAKFIHGDIKPDNILLRPNRQLRRASQRIVPLVKGDDEQSYRDRSYAYMIVNREYQPVFGDLGCAIDTSERKLDNYPATPAYLSPEVLLDGRMSPKRDIYALTVSFVEMLTGVRPYSSAQGLAAIGRSMVDKLPPFDLDKVFERTMDRMMSCQSFDNSQHALFEKVMSNVKNVARRALEFDHTQRASTFELIQDCAALFQVKSTEYVDCDGKKRQRWTQDVLPRLEVDDLYFRRKHSSVQQ